MAKADKHSMGAGAQGKGSGSGALTEADPSEIPENMVLSNRDKKQHTKDRGLDGKAVLAEQLIDHSGNKDPS